MRVPLLVGWSGGPRASALMPRGRDAVIEAALSRLGAHCHVSQPRLRSLVRGAWMHDWERDPFSRGAYSYGLVGAQRAASWLARPVAGTLFFAGEATATQGRSGTVHGAIGSGIQAARRILTIG